jgi:hypothetical protein
VNSKDTRRHVDWILDQLLPKRDEILSLLQEPGCRMDIFCYWLSKGSGGPILSPFQMAKLVQLDLEIGFDVYG